MPDGFEFDGVQDAVGIFGGGGGPGLGIEAVVGDALEVVSGAFLELTADVLVAAGIDDGVDVHVGGEVGDEFLAQA